MWRQTLPLQKPPTPRSPRRQDVGCSADGAISTKSVLNNPLPQRGEGSESIEGNTFSVAEILGAGATKRLLRSMSAAFLPREKKKVSLCET